MTDFNPALHPRGHHSNPGRFAAKAHTEPESALDGDLITLAPGEGDLVLDGMVDAAVERINVTRDDEDPALYRISAEARIDYAWLAPKHLPEAAKHGWVDDHRALIDGFLSHRYGVIANHDEETDPATLAWVSDEVEHRGPLTVTQASDIAYDQTELPKLFDEADSGTFGAENMTRVFAEFAAEHHVVPDFYSARTAAAELTDTAIDSEVRARSGQREIRDVTAVAIAARLVSEHQLPELRRLAVTGHCHADRAHREITSVYNDVPYAKRSRLDMLHTWLLHGGDAWADPPLVS